MRMELSNKSRLAGEAAAPLPRGSHQLVHRQFG